MDVSQQTNTGLVLTMEISTLFTLFTEVESAVLPQSDAFTYKTTSSAEPAIPIMM